MNTIQDNGTSRLLKLVKLSKTADQFVADILRFPKWYLQNDFLKRQTKAYFYQFYATYGGK